MAERGSGFPDGAGSRHVAFAGTTRQPPQTGWVFFWGVWFGLVTGLGEVVIAGWKKCILGEPFPCDWNILWMVPLVDVILFSPAAVFLCILGRWRPMVFTSRLAVGAFGFLAFYILLLDRPIYSITKPILAAGLACAFCRLIGRFSDGFNRFIVRTAWCMTLLIAVTSVTLSGWQSHVEKQALSRLPPAPQDAPNVLLITLDTVRAANLSLHGYSRDTSPRLKQLARRGARFELALATAPWTLPSHSSMFTGRYPHELSAGWKAPLDAAYPTLAEVLSTNGYDTAGFVANTSYCNREYGLNRGFTHYEDYSVTPGQALLFSASGRHLSGKHRLRNFFCYHELLNRKTAAAVNDSFLHWLSQPRQRPFFAFLNYFDAHEPYLPPEPFNTRFGPGRRREWSSLWPSPERGTKEMRDAAWQLSPDEVQVEIDAYDGSLAYLDHHLGLLFDELDRRSVLNNTLVIITSDHGEQFGEHGLFSHSTSVYLSVLHVPLVVFFPPQIAPGISVREAVTLRDIPATVVDLLNLRQRETFPGTSLCRHLDPAKRGVNASKEMLFSEADLLRGWDCSCQCQISSGSPVLSEVQCILNRNTPHWYPSAQGPLQSLLAGNLHYIKQGEGLEELYDISTDPLERRNLAGLPDSQDRLESFRKGLENLRTSRRR